VYAVQTEMGCTLSKVDSTHSESHRHRKILLMLQTG